VRGGPQQHNKIIGSLSFSDSDNRRTHDFSNLKNVIRSFARGRFQERVPFDFQEHAIHSRQQEAVTMLFVTATVVDVVVVVNNSNKESSLQQQP
jgi:hypothetical protein